MNADNIKKDLAEELKYLEKLVLVKDVRDIFVSLCERSYLRGAIRGQKEARSVVRKIIQRTLRRKG